MRNASDDETNSKTEDLTKLCTKIKKYRKTVKEEMKVKLDRNSDVHDPCWGWE